MHRGVLQFYGTWCGSYHIDYPSQWHVARLPPIWDKRCWAMQVNTWTMCNIKVGTHKHGSLAPIYIYIYILYEEEVVFHQQCDVRVLVFPRRHQALCEWQQQEICVELTYSTYHIACENRYQFVKGGGFNAQRCRILIAAEEGTFSSL